MQGCSGAPFHRLTTVCLAGEVDASSMRLLLLLIGGTAGLDDGLARTPPMGYRTWNDVAGVVNTTYMRTIVDAIV